MAEIFLYSTSSCPYCVMAKEYFESNNIEYTLKDVENDLEARKEFVSKGHTGVPVIVIDGEEILGFDKARIESILSK